jgi:predicted HTH domain antitoxin
MEVEVPQTLLQYIDHKNPAYQDKLQKLMLYQLVMEDKISFGRAAEILEIDKISFIKDLSQMGISFFNQSIDEVLEDINTISVVLGNN